MFFASGEDTRLAARHGLPNEGDADRHNPHLLITAEDA